MKYEYQNANSGKCLDFIWHSDDNGDPAVQYTCGRQYYGWRWEYYNPSGGYPLRPKGHNGIMCLEVENFSTANFAAVSQHACNGGPHQQWQWVPSGYTYGDSFLSRWLSNSFMLRNVWSGKCLEWVSPRNVETSP